MPLIKFTVFGDPKAKAIGLAQGKRNDGTTYIFPATSKAQRQWKRAVLEAAKKVKPAEPYTGAVELELDFYLPAPQRLSKSEQYDHLTKPDNKNLYEMIEDTLMSKTCKFYEDDGQVVSSIIHKHYARELVDGQWRPTSPRVEVTVRLCGNEKEEVLRPK